MFDFLGYTCYSPAWELFGWIFSVVMWLWFVYLAVRLRNVKRGLKAAREGLRAAESGRRVDAGGAAEWDIGSPAMRPVRLPAPPPRA